MKTRFYLSVQVVRNNGEHYSNPLKLSEVALINKIVKENRSISITYEECTPEEYKTIF